MKNLNKMNILTILLIYGSLSFSQEEKKETGDTSLLNVVTTSKDTQKIITDYIGNWQLYNTIEIGGTRDSRAITFDISSPDGKSIAIGYSLGNVKLLSSKTGELVKELKITPPNHISGLLSYSLDGKHLSVPQGKMTKIWDVESAKEIINLPISNSFYSNDGNYLIGKTNNQNIEFYDTQNYNLVKTFDIESVENSGFFPPGLGKLFLAYTPKYLAYYLPGNKVVHLIDIDTQKQHPFESYGSFVNSIDFSGDGKYLAILSVRAKESMILVWNIETKEIAYRVDGLHTMIMKFSPISNYLAVGMSPDLKIIDLKRGKIIKLQEEKAEKNIRDVISSIRFSSDGKYLAYFWRNGAKDLDNKKIKIWENEGPDLE